MSNPADQPPSEAGQSAVAPPVSQRPKLKRGRPPINAGVPPRAVTFFDHVQAIPFEDWGTRAKIRVYRLAPLIDRLRGSECKFICIYMEAISEDKLKADHGSGRYRLYLAYKGATDQGDRDLDRIELDILDPKFPPNVPAGEWMDDPRNKIWAWGKPAGAPGPTYPIPGVNAPYPPQPQGQQPVESVLEGMRLATEIRKDVRDEMKTETPATPSPPQTVDPWAAAERILNMRSENPMVTILQKQIEAMQTTMDRERDSFEKLQGEFFQAQISALKSQLGEKPKNLIEQAAELAQAAEKLKGLFGMTGTAAEAAAPIKSRMNGWMELATELVPTVINSPIINALAQRLAPTATPPPQTINVQPQVNGAQTPAAAQQELFEFVNRSVTPALIEYLQTGNSGGAFAEWLYNGFPQRLTELQNVTHPMLPNLKGAPVIVQLYQHSPAWAELSKYPTFPTFVDEFCKWAPEEEDAQTPSPAPANANETDNDF